MRNTFYTLLIMLLAVVNLQAQNNHAVKVPEPDGEVVVGAIGGTVDVSALGGATYTIPIQVPEGLGGVQPNLFITYNSQSGNGLLGWGWNLGGMSAITRVGRTLYHDNEVCGIGLNYKDRYALDGQRLMLIEGEYGGNGAEYKTEVDGMCRIVSHTEERYADGPAYFTVYTPEGLTLYYGWDKSGDNNARIIWEKDGVKKIVLWLLKRVEDQNGNYMVYNYCIGGHDYRLTDIQYCANPAARNEPDNERGAKYGVDFKYTGRIDKETSFVGDYVLRQPWRLDTISVYYYNRPLYDYVFQYDGSCGQINTDCFYNRLQSVKLETNDGNGYKETIIKWGNVNPNKIYKTVLNDDVLGYMSGLMKFTGDFNGDGLSDLIVVSEPHDKSEKGFADEIEEESIHYIDYENDSVDDDKGRKLWRTIRIYLNRGHNKSDDNNGSMSFDLMDTYKYKRLQWIYSCDLDGDGCEEIVFLQKCWDVLECYYEITAIRLSENEIFDEIPFQGHFPLYHYTSPTFWNEKEGHLLVGDFLATGQQDMILQLPKMSFNYIPFLYFHYDHDAQALVMENSSVPMIGTVFQSADFDGDGYSEIWYADKNDNDKIGKVVKIYRNDSGQLSYSTVCRFLDAYSENFYGDFNGDGHTDVLTYHNMEGPGGKTWRLLIWGKDTHSYPVYSLSGVLGADYPGCYCNDLNKLEERNYFFQIADINGDGKSDVFCRTGTTISTLYGPVIGEGNPDENGVMTGRFSRTCSFELSQTGLGSVNNYSICLGNFLGQENSSAVNYIYVFSLSPHSSYYNVSSIIDGMGNQVSFEYDYLIHNPEKANIYSIDNIGQNLSFDIYHKPLPIRAVKAIETTNINVSGFPISRTDYHYDNAMVHKFGHGFLGFQGITQTSSIGSRKIGKTVRTFYFKPMGEHCTLTPESELVYRYMTGETAPVLISDTYYEHAKFVCELDKLGKVFVPAAVKTTTKNYELLGDRQLLRYRVNEVNYNDKTGFGPFTYTQLVHPTESWQGTDGASQDNAQNCEFLTHTRTHYMGIAEPWVINRPKEIESESTRRTSGFANAKSLTLYTYMSDRPYLTETITNYPSGSVSSTDKLATRTTFEYRPNGLLESETVSAFNDHELVGRERVTRYDYTPSLRFLCKEDKQDGYVTQYGYDEVWGELQWTDDCNGFRTLTDNPDHLGLTTYTYDADNTQNHSRINGTESATALRWIGCENYKTKYASDLSEAFYFSWTKGEGSAESLTIYDAGGRELRTVTHGLTENDIIYQDTKYDDWGHVLKVSEPYFKNSDEEDVQWTSYEYDDFDRVERTDYPKFELEENGTNVTCYPSTETTYQDLTSTTKTGVSLSLNGDFVKSHTTSTTLNFMGWTDSNVEELEEGENTTSYAYNADGSLAWTKVNGQDFTKVSMEYDDTGNRITLIDPDYGQTSSKYDAFGQLTYQETPKGDYTTFEYDRHGRQTSRTETTLISGLAETTTWTFKENQGQRGLLESITLDNRQTVTYNYDAAHYNRLSTESETIEGETYTTAYAYSSTSFPLRASGITYPTGFEVTKEYEPSTGKLRTIKHGDKELWHTDEANALGQITRFTYGNGVESVYEYDERHLLKSQTAENIQDFAYTYDYFANLAARTDNRHGMTESFEYDYLNRLEKITLNGTESIMGYDEYGRITSKQAQGEDVFSDAVYEDWKKPHAIRQATVTANPFDGRSQTIQYTMFDKVASIRVQEKQTLSYLYGYDHQRIKLTEIDFTEPMITCAKTYVGNCEFWNGNVFGPAKSLTYLSGPMGVFAVVEKNADDESLHYIYKDHLGSWTTITDAEGNIEQEASFDAWGNIRSASDWTSPMSEKLLFDRGYTGHEHLYFYGRCYHPNAPHTDLGLINMNGRMYDPVMSSFLSVDNYVQSTENSQNFNRYAYCLNNPLRYTDPDGEWFLTFGLDYGKNSNGNFGVTGLSLGINFGTFGFGTHFNWGNGFTAGLYGEVGPHIGCAGVNATLGFDYNFTYGTSTLSLSGGYGASYGIGRASLGGNVSYTFGLPAGVNGFNANVTAGLGLAGNINKFGQQAGFGLSGSYGTSGWGFGAHSYCEMIPVSEKLNRIVDYYKDDLAAVGDADATVKAQRYVYDDGKLCNGKTVPGEGDIHEGVNDQYGHCEDNTILLNYRTVRRIWRGDIEATETLFHEWKHGVQLRSGEANELISLYGANIASDIMEVRAYCFDYNRIHTAYRYNRIHYYGFDNPKHPNSLIRAWMIDEGLMKRP